MSYDQASDLVEVVETHRAARASAPATDVCRAIDDVIAAFHDEVLAYVPDFDIWEE